MFSIVTRSLDWQRFNISCLWILLHSTRAWISAIKSNCLLYRPAIQYDSDTVGFLWGGSYEPRGQGIRDRLPLSSFSMPVTVKKTVGWTLSKGGDLYLSPTAALPLQLFMLLHQGSPAPPEQHLKKQCGLHKEGRENHTTVDRHFSWDEIQCAQRFPSSEHWLLGSIAVCQKEGKSHKDPYPCSSGDPIW